MGGSHRHAFAPRVTVRARMRAGHSLASRERLAQAVAQSHEIPRGRTKQAPASASRPRPDGALAHACMAGGLVHRSVRRVLLGRPRVAVRRSPPSRHFCYAVRSCQWGFMFSFGARRKAGRFTSLSGMNSVHRACLERLLLSQ